MLEARIEQKVTEDAIAQYNVAKDTGSAMDACVHAGLVKAAFIQAKDERKAGDWRATEIVDCHSAGLPGD